MILDILFPVLWVAALGQTAASAAQLRRAAAQINVESLDACLANTCGQASSILLGQTRLFHCLGCLDCTLVSVLGQSVCCLLPAYAFQAHSHTVPDP
jgi:hypothetical protein